MTSLHIKLFILRTFEKQTNKTLRVYCYDCGIIFKKHFYLDSTFILIVMVILEFSFFSQKQQYLYKMFVITQLLLSNKIDLFTVETRLLTNMFPISNKLSASSSQ